MIKNECKSRTYIWNLKGFNRNTIMKMMIYLFSFKLISVLWFNKLSLPCVSSITKYTQKHIGVCSSTPLVTSFHLNFVQQDLTEIRTSVNKGKHHHMQIYIKTISNRNFITSISSPIHLLGNRFINQTSIVGVLIASILWLIG